MQILTKNVEMDATEVFQAIEEIKNVNPGVIQTYLKGLVPDIVAFLIQIAVAAVVYLIGVQVIRLLRKFLKKWLTKREADIGVKQFLDALIKYVCYFILFMMILSVFGVATTSAVALLGSMGLTIGLALQGSLSNFAGGVLILLLKPFKVGDYIIEDVNKNEGTVKEISVFYTKLTTPDNRVIIIPNGTLANSSLMNVTQSEKRRVDIYVGVSYQADLKKAKSILTELAEQEINRLKDEPMDIFVSDLEDSSVKLGVRIWVPTDSYWETRWRLVEEVKLALDAGGIEIPYPQMDVTIKKTQ
jgi:small conductance mechanosensitive channel